MVCYHRQANGLSTSQRLLTQKTIKFCSLSLPVSLFLSLLALPLPTSLLLSSCYFLSSLPFLSLSLYPYAYYISLNFSLSTILYFFSPKSLPLSHSSLPLFSSLTPSFTYVSPIYSFFLFLSHYIPLPCFLSPLLLPPPLLSLSFTLSPPSTLLRPAHVLPHGGHMCSFAVASRYVPSQGLSVFPQSGICQTVRQSQAEAAVHNTQPGTYWWPPNRTACKHPANSLP